MNGRPFLSILMSGVALLVGAQVLAAGGASAASPARTAAAKAVATCDRGQFGVIVDVGHTAQSPGANSARGTTEFEFNLQLAKNVERELVQAGFSRATMLVTEGRSRPGLMQRIVRANKSGADLLLSIHHDSVPEKFKQAWDYRGSPHSYSDRFSGHSLFVSVDNSRYRDSLMFGRFLGNELRTQGLIYTPHYIEDVMGNRKRLLVDHEAGVYRYDQLLVLKKTRMPAVLLEAGMIVNRNDELALADPARQAAIGQAVVHAVAGYCEARATPRGGPAVRVAKTVERPVHVAKVRRKANAAKRLAAGSAPSRLASHSPQ